MGGRPVDVADDPKRRRRTVYGLVDRQSLPAVFRAFDFASPDHSAERRPRTTVPQQALFSMNSPLVIEQARALAARPEVAGAADPGGPDRRALPPRPRPAARSRRAGGRPRFLAASSAGGSSPRRPVRSSTACSSSPRCCYDE